MYEGINTIGELISELKNGTKFTNIGVKRKESINSGVSSLMGTLDYKGVYSGLEYVCCGKELSFYNPRETNLVLLFIQVRI